MNLVGKEGGNVAIQRGEARVGRRTERRRIVHDVQD